MGPDLVTQKLCNESDAQINSLSSISFSLIGEDTNISFCFDVLLQVLTSSPLSSPSTPGEMPEIFYFTSISARPASQLRMTVRKWLRECKNKFLAVSLGPES